MTQSDCSRLFTTSEVNLRAEEQCPTSSAGETKHRELSVNSFNSHLPSCEGKSDSCTHISGTPVLLRPINPVNLLALSILYGSVLHNSVSQEGDAARSPINCHFKMDLVWRVFWPKEPLKGWDNPNPRLSRSHRR